ncbi:MAG: hypothetical protein LUI08_05695 [Prevotella sp.]|nr:hypothetical protein [Prevotella sp.]
MKKSVFYLMIIVAGITAGCSHKTTAGAYQEYKIQCLGVELDGSQTLVSWGEGRNRADAVEQAKKNAVHEVIFNGIHDGAGSCEQRPLLNIPNAAERYREYFQRFFADGGEYTKYVSTVDEKSGSRNVEKYQYGRKMSVTVRVLRAELRERLQKDNVLH